MAEHNFWRGLEFEAGTLFSHATKLKTWKGIKESKLKNSTPIVELSSHKGTNLY